MDTVFRCYPTFLLRAPLLPRHRLRAAPTADDGMRERLGSPLLREAVAVASPALAAAADKVQAGQEPASPRLRSALARYELRMAGRPTPFGLLAGVALGEFADHVDAVLGSAHRRHVQPDHAWLSDWADELEADAEVLARLEVRPNNLFTRHGDRLSVPHGKRLASVRATAVVDHVLRAAADGIRVADLVDVVAQGFPGLDRSRVAPLVTQLVRLGFLRTPLRHAEDPLAAFPDHQRAARIQDLIDDYRRSPLGSGTAQLAALRCATGADSPVQVDLELDARVKLPRNVARELERTADAVWRLSAMDNARSRALTAYHARFLERYGLGELVPVTDLLDPDVGIGPAADYEKPWTADPDDARQPVLNRLLVQALVDGVREVVLDDDLIAQLSPPGGTPPATAELFTTLHAVSPEALDRGEFELVLNPVMGTQLAGASFGRFGHLPGVRELLADLASRDDRVPVQLTHVTTEPRHANVTRAPLVLDHSLAVGTGQASELRLTEIAVAADAHRLRLYSVSLGREIVPRLLHVLDISTAAPEVVRFLWDVSMMGVRTLKPWNWAALRDSPFLPAIRYGRAVLSPATWRVTADDVATDDALTAWRKRWGVPDRVRLTQVDQQLCLDLTASEHRVLLREDTRKSGTAVVCEDRAPDRDQGWLRGPEGVHEAELVVPLIAVEPVARPVKTPFPLRTKPVVHLPGGEWVSAHLQCSPHRQREVLAGHLRPWLATLESEVDRWFFVRYEAEDQRPHIRLRLHGDVLPRLREQLAALADARLAGEFSLHVYRPEVERYGGEHLIGLAERFFTADSRLVLRRMATGQDIVAVAADVVALVSLFHGEDWPRWLLSAFPKNETTHKAFTRRRRDALAAVTLDPVPGDEEWAELLTRYGKEAATNAGASPDEILRALLHLHCNRRLGTDFRAEAEVYAIARGAVQAHLDRRRAAR
ncbi:mRNA interferase HicA [Amycolatopsis sacchari]|uniref:mRNA interferase HicA n=1 Tax=Amycolatopsis sacchari TaxID=115433 RepID=A0A1I3T169_9PSEU|nr:lantibiotic dehydratase [Amycolatopsis sacchari]SFJ63591.1 mRNA interferase HicA [Amycolatopsis sacchari]